MQRCKAIIEEGNSVSSNKWILDLPLEIWCSLEILTFGFPCLHFSNCSSSKSCRSRSFSGLHVLSNYLVPFLKGDSHFVQWQIHGSEWKKKIMKSFYLECHLGSVISCDIKALQWSFSATLKMVICVWQSKYFIKMTFSIHTQTIL